MGPCSSPATLQRVYLRQLTTRTRHFHFLVLEGVWEQMTPIPHHTVHSRCHQLMPAAAEAALVKLLGAAGLCYQLQ
jgi:hypothetical protein